MKTILSPALLLLAAPLLSAQAPAAAPAGATVAGAVVAAATGAPLPGAAVRVRAEGDSTRVFAGVTRADGRFTVGGLRPGRYTVRVSHLGYAPSATPVEVAAGPAPVDVGRIELAAAAVELEGIEVEGEKSAVILAPDRTIYQTRDMPAASGGVATDILRNVPEVDVDVDGKVSLRGSEGVTIHVNGRPSPLQGEALANFLRQLPADRIERIEVMPNPSAKYDPEGTAGILNLVMKDGVNLGLGGSVSVRGGTNGETGGSGQIAYQRGRLSLFGSGSLSMNDGESSFHAERSNLLAQPVTSLLREGSSENGGMFLNADASIEFKLSEKDLLWSSFQRWGGENTNDGITSSILRDPSLVLEEFDRYERGEWSHGSTDLSLGIRRQIDGDAHELSAELKRNEMGSGQDQRYRLELLARGGLPVDLPDEELWNDMDQEESRTSLQADYTRPLPRGAKLEAGYRAEWRGMDESQAGSTLAPGVENEISHRETFHSAYLTLGGALGSWSAQAGLRGETADTELELLAGETFSNDYASLFPSANLAYDFGEGRQLRLTYSKRIQRPWVFMLSPLSNSLDPLNIRRGNPYLEPQYTHSWSADLSWNTPLGNLKVGPYLRSSVNGWEQVFRVDAAGVSTATWENVASSRAYGSSLTLSVSPIGPVSGFVNFNGNRITRDVSNLGIEVDDTPWRWSMNANATYRATPNLSAQGFLRYMGARDLPQGMMSPSMMTSFSLRQQLWNRKASLGLSVNDPFDTFRFERVTADQTHTETSLNDFSMRRVSLSFTWNFGKPPRSERPRDQEPTEAPPEPIR